MKKKKKKKKKNPDVMKEKLISLFEEYKEINSKLK